MNILLSIFEIHFGGNAPVGDSFKFWPLFNTVVGSILGSAAGFGTAYFMFMRNQEAVKAKAESDKNEIRSEKHNFFITMISQVPDKIDSQIKICANQVERLDNNIPGTYVAAERQDVTILKRIYESNENEQYLHSFVNSSKADDKKNKTALFIELYNLLDLTYLELTTHFDFLDMIVKKVVDVYAQYRIILLDLEANLVEIVMNREFEKLWPKDHAAIRDLYFEYIKIDGDKRPFDYPIKIMLPSIIKKVAGPLLLNLKLLATY